MYAIQLVGSNYGMPKGAGRYTSLGKQRFQTRAEAVNHMRKLNEQAPLTALRREVIAVSK